LTDQGIEPADPPEQPEVATEPDPTDSASDDLDALFAPVTHDEESDFRLRLDFPAGEDVAPDGEAPAASGPDYDDTTGLDLFARTNEPDEAPAAPAAADKAAAPSAWTPAPAAAPEAEPVDRHYPDLFGSKEADPGDDDASWFGPRGEVTSSRSDSDDDVPESWVLTSGRSSGSDGHPQTKADRNDRKRRGPRGRHRRPREDAEVPQAPEPPSDSMGPVPVTIPARRRFGSLLRVVAIVVPVAAAGVAYLSYVR